MPSSCHEGTPVVMVTLLGSCLFFLVAAKLCFLLPLLLRTGCCEFKGNKGVIIGDTTQYYCYCYCYCYCCCYYCYYYCYYY